MNFDGLFQDFLRLTLILCGFFFGVYVALLVSVDIDKHLERLCKLLNRRKR